MSWRYRFTVPTLTLLSQKNDREIVLFDDIVTASVLLKQELLFFWDKSNRTTLIY